MLVTMNNKAKRLPTWIAVFGLLFINVMLGQGQENQKQKAGAPVSDLTPITLSMKWTRGDPHYGPQYISLSTPCQASGDLPCECTMEFKVINSQEFADYIASFSSGAVPVVYEVRYGPDLLAQGARLESVGSWQADRFHVNERLLGIRYTFKGGKIGQKQTAKFHSPADCFPPKGN